MKTYVPCDRYWNTLTFYEISKAPLLISRLGRMVLNTELRLKEEVLQLGLPQMSKFWAKHVHWYIFAYRYWFLSHFGCCFLILSETHSLVSNWLEMLELSQRVDKKVEYSQSTFQWVRYGPFNTAILSKSCNL